MSHNAFSVHRSAYRLGSLTPKSPHSWWFFVLAFRQGKTLTTCQDEIWGREGRNAIAAFDPGFGWCLFQEIPDYSAAGTVWWPDPNQGHSKFGSLVTQSTQPDVQTILFRPLLNCSGPGRPQTYWKRWSFPAPFIEFVYGYQFLTVPFGTI